ncbi:glyceraldehyde-3-phosphate dehydrogenase [Salisediminibacterium selenitireducens]|uniref:Glyceraldehyde-3-phosphate dehydrogenase n=1 Tax=Bacillus selenitireducens (strain ATCC 700615 / DSM 15326 / MLS10) TaxID=439292 RepID=D6XST8_BACIE|nr:glyceraldehyde-3-phosphate dehydrogenase [Salisediminibacterium selenitireducens]ADH98874.1 glyceraldehyde-3-phosphate dehydrogenase, type I [[Bacillus] selenitireducens MLS10]
MIKTAINGFGRIGRMVFRQLMADTETEVVAVNATYPVETLAHLIRYDSIHGTWDADIRTEGQNLIVNGRHVRVCQERNPALLPWGELGIDIVVEATGAFTDRDKAALHLDAGADKVLITAPGQDADLTIVMGVNHFDYDPSAHRIISNASCTTNCLAPVAKVIHDAFGIVSGVMTTVHSYTNDQKNIDNPHKDLRRARACATSIIPTSTGAAKAIGLVLPELKGKMHGMALRVPTPNVSLVDLVVEVHMPVDRDQVNGALRQAAGTSMKGVLSVCDDPLVSTDFNGNPHSSIVDSLSTMVMNEHTVKILSWYDNEWGYASRVCDAVRYTAVPKEAKTATLTM